MEDTIVSVGVDVSAKQLDIAYLRKDGRIDRQKVTNSTIGYKEYIRLYQKKCSASSASVIVESTGGYHLGLAFFLQKNMIPVYVINPLISSGYHKMTIRKTKTDTTDAQRLARIGVSGVKLYPFHQTEAEILVKKITRMRSMYLKLQQRLKVSINQMMDLRDMTGIDISQQLKILNHTYDSLKHTVKTLNELLVQQAAKLYDMEHIGKIPGVSQASLAGILTEMGDMKRFKTAKQAVAYAGLDPSVCESGTSVHQASRLSKRGSPTLRGILFHVAWGLMMKNQLFTDFYKKKRREGKHYYTCLIAIARKFLTQLFYVIKHNLIFNSHSP